MGEYTRHQYEWKDREVYKFYMRSSAIYTPQHGNNQGSESIEIGGIHRASSARSMHFQPLVAMPWVLPPAAGAYNRLAR